ncbi:hypothetical protein ES703_118694 [subsurface metagenome]
MLVATECRREDDDVTLVALHVLHVLDEEAHILAILGTLALAHQCVAKCLIVLGTIFQSIFDGIGLLAVERNDPDR